MSITMMVRRTGRGYTLVAFRYIRSLGIFFFQAEDGIRDTSVTGVQTCALPILEHIALADAGLSKGNVLQVYRLAPEAKYLRSEERRVGKECRSRWSRHHQKKKHKRPGQQT